MTKRLVRAMAPFLTLKPWVGRARFYESQGCIREASGGHIGVTEVKNRPLDKKRAD